MLAAPRRRVAGRPTSRPAEVTHVHGASTDHHPYRMIVEHHRSLLRFARKRWTGPRRVLLVARGGAPRACEQVPPWSMQALGVVAGASGFRQGDRVISPPSWRGPASGTPAPRSEPASGARSAAAGRQWFYGAMALIVILGVGGIVLARRREPVVGHAAPARRPGNRRGRRPLARRVRGEHLRRLDLRAGDLRDGGRQPQRPRRDPHARRRLHPHPPVHSFGGRRQRDPRQVPGLRRLGSVRGLDRLRERRAKWDGLSRRPVEAHVVDGDKCPAGTPFAGKKGVVKWSLDCKAQSGDPSDLKLADQTVVALAFLPEERGDRRPAERERGPAARPGLHADTAEQQGVLDGWTRWRRSPRRCRGATTDARGDRHDDRARPPTSSTP